MFRDVQRVKMMFLVFLGTVFKKISKLTEWKKLLFGEVISSAVKKFSHQTPHYLRPENVPIAKSTKSTKSILVSVKMFLETLV